MVQELLFEAERLCKNFQLPEAFKLHNKLLEFQLENVDIKPIYSTILVMLGVMYEGIGRATTAIELYEKAVIADEYNVDALNNLANYAGRAGDNTLAKEYLNKVLSIHPHSEYALNNMGNIMMNEGDYPQALSYFTAALQYNSHFIIAHINKAAMLRALKRNQEAILHYEDVLRILEAGIQSDALNQKEFLYAKVFMALNLCHLLEGNWEFYEQNKAECLEIIDNILDKKLPPVLDPFEAMLLDLSAEQHFKLSVLYGEQFEKQGKHLEVVGVSDLVNAQKTNEKLKIGYISSDFGGGPLGYLIKDILPFHDKSRFEIFAFSLCETNDEINSVIQNAVDHYYECAHYNDTDLTAMIKNHNIDILIDLNGYTGRARNKVLCYKPAKVQAHWLGYSATTGIKAIDYYITTKAHVNESLEPYFTEKVIHLPQTFIAAHKADLPKVTRADLGLPEDKFIFCCLHLSYRINQAVFKTWLEILKEVPNSVLWLLSHNNERDERMKLYAKSQGISSERLIFSENEPLSQRFRHQVADLWLDTFLLTAGTGSMLCIQAGLPMLTLSGKTPQSRMAASYWHSLQIPECVVSSNEEYVQKAVALAKNPELLQSLKIKIQKHAQESNLFKPNVFIKELEETYLNMMAVMRNK